MMRLREEKIVELRAANNDDRWYDRFDLIGVIFEVVLRIGIAALLVLIGLYLASAFT